MSTSPRLPVHCPSIHSSAAVGGAANSAHVQHSKSSGSFCKPRLCGFARPTCARELHVHVRVHRHKVACARGRAKVEQTVCDVQRRHEKLQRRECTQLHLCTPFPILASRRRVCR